MNAMAGRRPALQKALMGASQLHRPAPGLLFRQHQILAPNVLSSSRARSLATYLRAVVAQHVQLAVDCEPTPAVGPKYVAHTYSCPLLQPLVRACKSWRALENLLRAKPDAIDATVLASVIAHLPRVLPHPYRKAIQKHGAPLHAFASLLLDRLAAHIPSLTPRDTALVLWSLAKLDFPCPPDTRTQLLLHAQSNFNRSSDQDLASFSWAAARMAPRAPLPPSLLPALESATLQPRTKCNGQDLGMLLWGLGTLHHTPSRLWLDNICAAVEGHLPALNGQNFSNVLWGIASMPAACPSPAWLTRILPAVQAQLHAMTNQNLVNVLWALGRLGHRQDPDFVAAWLQAAAGRLPLFNAQDVANTVWALAHLKHRPPPEWMQRLLAASASRSAQYRPQQVAALLWGLAELGVRPEPRWVAVHVAAVVGGSAQLEARWVAAILGALVEFGVRVPELTELLVGEALQQPTCSLQTFQRIVRHLVALQFRPSPRWVNEYLLDAAHRAPRLPPDHICTLIWTTATVGTAPHPSALGTFVHAITSTQVLQRCNHHETYRLVMALARLPVALPPEVWGRLRLHAWQAGHMMEAVPRQRLRAALHAMKPQGAGQADARTRQQRRWQPAGQQQEVLQQEQWQGWQGGVQPQKQQQQQQQQPQHGSHGGYVYRGDAWGAMPLVHVEVLRFASRK